MRNQLFDIELRTPNQVAELLGVKSQTVLYWIRVGRLPHYKVGGRYFIADTAIASVAKTEEMERV
ncbi:MAG: helix-turn-helix domain-containing protein [Bryobacteraceae bacterium]